jgi:ribosome-binding protein aMBF1 (putative translation factor)
MKVMRVSEQYKSLKEQAGIWLRRQRRDHGMNQRALAAEVKRSANKISRWENGDQMLEADVFLRVCADCDLDPMREIARICGEAGV